MDRSGDSIGSHSNRVWHCLGVKTLVKNGLDWSNRRQSHQRTRESWRYFKTAPKRNSGHHFEQRTKFAWSRRSIAIHSNSKETARGEQPGACRRARKRRVHTADRFLHTSHSSWHRIATSQALVTAGRCRANQR